MSTKKPNINDFQKVAIAKGGIIASIALSFGVSRLTIYKWCTKDERFQKAIDESRETFIDICESNLQTLCKGIPKVETDESGIRKQTGWEEKPSESAITFVLRTIGKQRGYVERIQTEEVNNPFFDLMRKVAERKKNIKMSENNPENGESVK